MAALVIFAMGVLVVLNLTSVLAAQMRRAATTGELVVRTQERLDSLESLPFASLAAGSAAETIVVRGVSYTRTTAITSVTAILKQFSVTMVRTDGAVGPTYSVTSYAAAPW